MKLKYKLVMFLMLLLFCVGSVCAADNATLMFSDEWEPVEDEVNDPYEDDFYDKEWDDSYNKEWNEWNENSMDEYLWGEHKTPISKQDTSNKQKIVNNDPDNFKSPDTQIKLQIQKVIEEQTGEKYSLDDIRIVPDFGDKEEKVYFEVKNNLKDPRSKLIKFLDTLASPGTKVISWWKDLQYKIEKFNNKKIDEFQKKERKRAIEKLTNDEIILKISEMIKSLEDLEKKYKEKEGILIKIKIDTLKRDIQEYYEVWVKRTNTLFPWI